MPKMTVCCGGSAESADIFRSFSFCSAWRRLAQFCSKKLTDRRSDREQSFNFANLTKPNEETTVFATIRTLSDVSVGYPPINDAFNGVLCIGLPG